MSYEKLSSRFFAKLKCYLTRAIAQGIILYQRAVSPWLGGHCRFSPSCSEYARQAVERFGLIQGLKMSILRITRCHPFHAGGYDPVSK